VSKQDDLYEDAAATYGAALGRLARGYEPDVERRRDLLQDIHLALWQSLDRFDGRCSIRTWTYRVAHNIAISKVVRRRGRTPTLVSLDELESRTQTSTDQQRPTQNHEEQFDRARAVERLVMLIHELKPLDRQVMLLYLEGLDGTEIGEVAGMSAANVATKIHRIKKLLAARFNERERNGD
jgi:RNA polymerase sigma-70 factor (ECF subfamily)